MSTHTRTEHANACAVSQEPSAISSMMRRIERMIDRGVSDKGGINRADLPSRDYIRSRTISIAPTIRNISTYQKEEMARLMRERGVWLDQPTIERIIALAASGMYAQDIAREIGVTRPAITSLMKRRGIEYKRMTRAECAQRGADVVKAMAARERAKQAA